MLESIPQKTLAGVGAIVAGYSLGYLGTYSIYPIMAYYPIINPSIGATYMAFNAACQVASRFLPTKSLRVIGSIVSIGLAGLTTNMVTGATLSLKSMILISASTVLTALSPAIFLLAIVINFFAVPILLILGAVVIFKFVQCCCPVPPEYDPSRPKRLSAVAAGEANSKAALSPTDSLGDDAIYGGPVNRSSPDLPYSLGGSRTHPLSTGSASAAGAASPAPSAPPAQNSHSVNAPGSISPPDL